MLNYYKSCRVGIGIPINIYLEHIKEFKLLWEDKTTTITNLVQLFENKTFFSNVSKDTGFNYYEPIEFILTMGCPAVKIEVSKPFLIYK